MEGQICRVVAAATDVLRTLFSRQPQNKSRNRYVLQSQNLGEPTTRSHNSRASQMERSPFGSTYRVLGGPKSDVHDRPPLGVVDLFSGKHGGALPGHVRRLGEVEEHVLMVVKWHEE